MNHDIVEFAVSIGIAVILYLAFSLRHKSQKRVFHAFPDQFKEPIMMDLSKVTAFRQSKNHETQTDVFFGGSTASVTIDMSWSEFSEEMKDMMICE